MITIAPQTIDALALVISGGGGNDTAPPIGLYRSGPKLESFMRSCGVMMKVGVGSRVPTLVDAIIQTANGDDANRLQAIIERKCSIECVIRRSHDGLRVDYAHVRRR